MKNRWLGRIVAIGGLLCFASTSALAQTTHIVTTNGLEFEPADITIQAGDSIMWTDLAAGFHNVVEADCPVTTGSAGNGGFSSGAPGATDTYMLTFNTPGEVCYLCEPHVALGMIGTITVNAAPAAIPTMGEWGLVALAGLLLAVGSRRLMRSHAARS